MPRAAHAHGVAPTHTPQPVRGARKVCVSGVGAGAARCAVPDLAALTQNGEHRRFRRPLQVLGALGCVLLMATLPVGSVAGGLAALAVGVVLRTMRLSRAGTAPGTF